MNDMQILTLAVTLLGIFVGSWLNNSRITDLSKKTDDRADSVRDVLRAEMKAMEARIDLQFERTNNKIDALLKTLADFDQRLTAVEPRKP